ncbi:MAG: glycoside hydrolase family 35, partial [Gemmatimonadaceae bacterium]
MSLRAFTAGLSLTALVASTASAQRSTEITIDATAQPVAPETGFLKFGSTRSHDGQSIAATSRYLTLDGKPWLPVMGEFHFSRYPEAEWDVELGKMRAGGVSIVSS